MSRWRLIRDLNLYQQARCDQVRARYAAGRLTEFPDDTPTDTRRNADGSPTVVEPSPEKSPHGVRKRRRWW